MRSVRPFLTALVLGLLLSACGQKEIDGRDVEDAISSSFPGKDVDVTCPDHVTSIPGRHFTCTLAFAGSQSPIRIDIEDADGRYSYRINILGGATTPELSSAD